MAKKSNNKIIGIVLMIVGVGLAIWGYQMSGSIGSQLNQAFSGSPTDKVLIAYVAGAVSIVVGLIMFRK